MRKSLITTWVLCIGVLVSNVTTATWAANANPTVSWDSPSSGSTVSGRFMLTGLAQADTNGTASISKWCFTSDGQPLTQGTGIGFAQAASATSADYYAGSSYGEGMTLDANGCGTTWRYARKVFLPYDSTRWANGDHTWTAKVTDSSGRESTVANQVVKVENALPTIDGAEVTSTADSLSILGSWQDSSTAGITVLNCTWEIDAVLVQTKTCASMQSSPKLGKLSPGLHSLKFVLEISTGDKVAYETSFTSKAFSLTASKTKITLTCPNSYTGKIVCSAASSNSLGVKGSLIFRPMYKIGSGSWSFGKSLKATVGNKYSVTFPGSKDSTSVKVVSTIGGETISSPTVTYLPDASTVLTRLQSASSVGWKKDKVLYSGYGYAPDSILLASDSSGYCSVWVWRVSSHFEADYNLGEFPWNSNPYWAFIDKRSGFGIFATVSKRNSNCSQSIKKTFGLK